jgi:mitogen-activated protein kinase 15
VHRSDDDNDLCLIFTLMEADLYSVIRAGILQDIHKRYIFWQLCCSLKYLHSARLLHRDIKPSNILINSDASIRLCDFGLSRTFDCEPDDSVCTDYVATRWYRPPEILLGSSSYSPSVDMWAAGCVLAELLSGRPLLPGTSAMDQLEWVVAFCGPPSRADIAAISSPLAPKMLSLFTYTHPRFTFDGFLPEDADLIQKLVVFNPGARLTAEQCLEHPFVAKFHAPSREPAAAMKIAMALSDSHTYTIRDYRNQTYREAVTAPDVPSQKLQHFHDRTEQVFEP